MTTKRTLAALLPFRPGTLVQCARVRDDRYRFRAKVVRPVKSRGVVTVEMIEGPRAGQYYDALPSNIDLAEGR